MPNDSHIWWAMRPSSRHPTLELRAPDVCTAVDDAIAIAALYRTLVRHLYYNPWRNHGMTPVSRALVVENKWRAQRYGIHGTFVTEEGAVTVAEMLERVIEETAADAQGLGCAEEIAHCRKIVGDGTSADAQLAVFQEQRGHASRKEALQAVAEWIVGATLR
jgi:glutamate---cysteine ligase / carboxylate-amine ligase